jgi:hypothetical protein
LFKFSQTTLLMKFRKTSFGYGLISWTILSWKCGCYLQNNTLMT